LTAVLRKGSSFLYRKHISCEWRCDVSTTSARDRTAYTEVGVTCPSAEITTSSIVCFMYVAILPHRLQSPPLCIFSHATRVSALPQFKRQQFARISVRREEEPGNGQAGISSVLSSRCLLAFSISGTPELKDFEATDFSRRTKTLYGAPALGSHSICIIVRRFPPTIRLARLGGEGQRYATNSDTQIAPKFVWANRADLHHNNALIF
jgi:hypothetical protein